MQLFSEWIKIKINSMAIGTCGVKIICDFIILIKRKIKREKPLLFFVFLFSEDSTNDKSSMIKRNSFFLWCTSNLTEIYDHSCNLCFINQDLSLVLHIVKKKMENN